MNTDIATARQKFPLFFADWDTDPYQAFLKVLGFHTYGFQDLGRDDYRTILEVAFDGLEISQYWKPRNFNPVNREFCKSMDSCIARFLDETPLDELSACKWLTVIKTLSWGYYPHPLLASWVANNLDLPKRVFRFKSLANSLIDAFETAAFAVASRHSEDYPRVMQWVRNRIALYPYSYRFHVKHVFKTDDERYTQGLFDMLPLILMGHRRNLHQLVQRNRGLMKRHPCFFKNKWEDVDAKNKEMRRYLTFIFLAQDRKSEECEEAAYHSACEKAEKMMVEHSARCPFPAI